MTSCLRNLANKRLLIVPILGFAAHGVAAQDGIEQAFAQELLAGVQMRSITENAEYCGYIGFDKAGELVASPPTRGDAESCLADDPANIDVITASYHTHGAYSPNYYNEVPSTDDIEGDEEEGIDGYVATPGGRLWYVDTGDMVISQICGLGCLPADVNFVPGDMGKIAPSYRYEDLVALLE